jgi:hypothetical protein
MPKNAYSHNYRKMSELYRERERERERERDRKRSTGYTLVNAGVSQPPVAYVPLAEVAGGGEGSEPYVVKKTGSAQKFFPMY